MGFEGDKPGAVLFDDRLLGFDRGLELVDLVLHLGSMINCDPAPSHLG